MGNFHINGSMQLDSCYFITEIFMLDRDVINMVVRNLAENTAHMAYHTVLSAVMDHIVADDMGTDFFLAPANLKSAEHGFHLILIARLAVPSGTQVMAGGGFLADTDTAAFCIMDFIIFYNPAFAPMGSQKAGLIGGGRRPRTCGLGHFKTADGNIVHSRFFGIEAAFTHIDLRQLLIGIGPLEIGINNGVFFLHFCIPLVYGIFRMKNRLGMLRPRGIIPMSTHDRVLHIRKTSGFVKGLSVQIHISCVYFISFRAVDAGIKKPVADQHFRIRIVIPEQGVGNNSLPYGTFRIFPVLDSFRAFNHHLFPFGGLIGDTADITVTGMGGFYPFPVFPFMDNNPVPGFSNSRRSGNCPERIIHRPFGTVAAVY